MKKFRWVKLTSTTNTKGKVCRDKQTGLILKGLMFDDNSDYWFGYSETTDEVDGYPITRLEVQQEVDFDLLRFDHTKYLDFEYEVVNRDDEVINKTDMLIAEDKICYKFLDKLYVVYINGRQNIQEEHFSDLLLRKEV